MLKKETQKWIIINETSDSKDDLLHSLFSFVETVCFPDMQFSWLIASLQGSNQHFQPLHWRWWAGCLQKHWNPSQTVYIAFMLESSHWMLQGPLWQFHRASKVLRCGWFPVLPPQQWRWPHSATGAVDAFGTVSKSLEQDGFCLQRQCQLELVNFRASV